MGRVAFFTPPSALAERAWLVLVLALAGCAPQIGDHCTTSTDCSQTGDRLCDISQPGGYCTVYNCEPGDSNAAAKCPDEAACIAFDTEPSPVSGCTNKLGATPYQRSFCMKRCNNGSDCRGGYVCVDLAQDPHVRAIDVDGATKVCTVPLSAPAPAPFADDQSPNVCTGTSTGAESGEEPADNAGASSGTTGAAGGDGT